MPIIDVEFVQPDGEDLPEGMAQWIADAAAGVFGCEPGRVWVRLRQLPLPGYAENGGLADGILPVFVRVLLARLPDRDALRAQAERLSLAIAETCGRQRENVHVLYQPEAAGRIAFGGVLLEE